MNYIKAALIGLIQGLTEFLPVSSSGHLVLAQRLLGINMPGVTFEVFLHVGTLISVIWVFRERLINIIKS
ncbi:MAG: undecaprenyl-diphosphate phosphatase, partial [Eubacteriales bacterium]|nr:undecaprenyl-diphosphate phosphatase [Eubacteriales bacterium]